MESDRIGFELPAADLDEKGEHTPAYRSKIKEQIRMAKFTCQGITVLLNADGKVAQVTYQGMVALAKSQANMAFTPSLPDGDKADLQSVIDRGLEAIRAEEGLEPAK